MKRFSKQYFNLIRQFSVTWLKARDRRMFLGVIWSFLNPFLIALTLFFIFRNDANHGGSFLIYILIGTIIWNFITISVQSATTIFLWRRDIVKNLSFPKEILTFGQVGMYVIEHIFEILILLGFILVMKIGFSFHIVLIPLIVFVEILLALSLATFLSFISAYAQDIEYIWAAFARVGLFIVPIFYTIESLSDRLQILVKYNPISQIMIFYRDILLYHHWPNMLNVVLVLAFAILFLFLNIAIFKKYEKNVVERV